MLTNDAVSFEQPGPDISCIPSYKHIVTLSAANRTCLLLRRIIIPHANLISEFSYKFYVNASVRRNKADSVKLKHSDKYSNFK